MSGEAYGFENLPLTDIRPGTSLLVAGPTHAGTRDLGLQLLAGPPGEGTIVITTNRRAARILDDCSRVGVGVAPDHTAVLDCVGDEDPGIAARVHSVSGASDLTGIGMRLSDVYVDFKRNGVGRARTGLCSLSTLLSYGDHRTIARFVHTLVGRIDVVDGLGIFLIDPSGHDDRTVSTIAQLCSGRIDVRDSGGGPELRPSGLPGQPREWLSFDPSVC